MIFEVRRASIHPKDHDTVSPCEGAFVYRHSFTVTNEKGESREIEDLVWHVAIPNIMGFVAEHGECIIWKAGKRGIPAITIYDDYIE